MESRVVSPLADTIKGRASHRADSAWETPVMARVLAKIQRDLARTLRAHSRCLKEESEALCKQGDGRRTGAVRRWWSV